MAEKLKHDPELCEKLIPKWEVGCRRITPGPGYLEAFSRPNCHLSDSKVTHISEGAVHTANGKVFDCDVGELSYVPASDIRFMLTEQSFAPRVLTSPIVRAIPLWAKAQ